LLRYLVTRWFIRRWSNFVFKKRYRY